ncbi:MAG TPA: class I mannose-6-phosphate isomerase [Allosphingosinicella sp.]|nr:class I mannose-6-phosphate isomerase [Allosphingosinicella sp.]
MTASRLASRQVEKLWGRSELPQSFGAAAAGGEPIGEIWFQDGRGNAAELLVKYLLTREKLSIQVHPDDATARAAGQERGKDEAWLVLEAEPDARIGLGLKRDVSKAELRAAIETGRLEDLVDWREARAGDFHYSPAGTIHALGPGLTLVEIQQNVDLTYRLHDYGRERELQVEAGVEAARPERYRPPPARREIEPGREILAEGGAFVVERWTRGAGGRLAGEVERPVWLVPVRGHGLIDGQALEPPSVWLVEDQSRVRIEAGSEMLFAYPGATVIESLFVDTRRSLPVERLDERRRYRPPVRLEPSFR